MSAVGYPDYQRITTWLGAPLVQGTGLVVGAGTHVDGPLEVANFASVILALKATGGNVTVTIKQTVPAGPASLVLTESVVVGAGATLFEAFVLYGQAVELEITGTIAGTSVDYALYGSNTTTNAQVITQATINVQSNDALVAAEPTLDFEDALGFAWTIADDSPNTRVKITPPPATMTRLFDTTLLASAASVDITGIPATYSHLRLLIQARGDRAAIRDTLAIRFNGDGAADYDGEDVNISGAVVSGEESLAQIFGNLGRMPAGTATAAKYAVAAYDILDYTGVIAHKSIIGTILGPETQAAGWANLETHGTLWRSTAAINRITLFPQVGPNFVAGSRVSLYGVR